MRKENNQQIALEHIQFIKEKNRFYSDHKSTINKKMNMNINMNMRCKNCVRQFELYNKKGQCEFISFYIYKSDNMLMANQKRATFTEFHESYHKHINQIKVRITNTNTY